ncbi:MAG: hypothetical protein NTZ74_05245 [Chloroflexi bacterium]|nr:hypothetical protein [Chloroflexota bacterium]
MAKSIYLLGNNRMELTAIIRVLRSLKEPSKVTFFIDSRYMQRGITKRTPSRLAKNWRGSNGMLLSQYLWKEQLAAAKLYQIT